MRHLKGQWPRTRASVLVVVVSLVASACGASAPTASPTQSAAPSTAPASAAASPSAAATSPAPTSAADAMVAFAKEQTAKAMAPTAGWAGPSTSPKPLPGKKIAVISSNQLAAGPARATAAVVDAAGVLGWTATVFDGKGTIDGALAAVNAAVDGKYDAIDLMIVDPTQIMSGINRALDAGIPVATLGEGPFTPEREALMAKIPDVSWPLVLQGEMLAYYMIATSDGNVNALLLLLPEVSGILYGQYKGVNDILSDPTKCPNCKVTTQQFTVAQIVDAPSKLAVAGVQADPTINWINCFDFCLARAVGGLVAAGLQANVKGTGYDCNAENLALIRQGVVQAACMSDPREWEAWATVDNLNRMMQGQPPVEQAIPTRLFTIDNMSELTGDDLSRGWQGGIDYRAEYMKLWGLISG